LLLAPEFYLPFRTLGLHHHAGMEGSAAALKFLTSPIKTTEMMQTGISHSLPEKK
jgi:ATP-binding cassette, subfamily C, bacterial CydD